MLLVILLVSISLWSAVDYMVETVGEESLVYLSIPYSFFNFRHKSGKFMTDSSVEISIYDKKKKLKFTETLQVRLHLNNRLEINKKKYPYLCITDLKKGQYLIKLKVISVNYDKEIRIHIRNSKDSHDSSSLYVFCYSGDSIYEPVDGIQDADSVIVRHYSSIRDASLSIINTDQKSKYMKEKKYFLYKTGMKTEEKDLKNGFIYSVKKQEDKTLHYKVNTVAYRFRRSHTETEQIEQLMIIERGALIRRMNKLKSEELEAALDSYWIQTDRTIGDNVNEYQLAFYNAVKLCNEKFSVFGYKMGWDSDMGRVFLEYGQPDEIVEEAYPRYEDYKDFFTDSVLDSFYRAVKDFSSIQIWFYYQKNKVFLFIEKYGANNYELQN